MVKLIPALLATVLFSIPFSAMSREMPQQTEDLGTTDGSWVKNFRQHNKQMDTDRDGMISKKEYMSHQEMMFEGLQKNEDGLVNMHDMDGMYAGTTRGNKLRPSGEPQPQDIPQ